MERFGSVIWDGAILVLKYASFSLWNSEADVWEYGGL